MEKHKIYSVFYYLIFILFTTILPIPKISLTIHHFCLFFLYKNCIINNY